MVGKKVTFGIEKFAGSRINKEIEGDRNSNYLVTFILLFSHFNKLW